VTGGALTVVSAKAQRGIRLADNARRQAVVLPLAKARSTVVAVTDPA
jgi:hypothetical protein